MEEELTAVKEEPLLPSIFFCQIMASTDRDYIHKGGKTQMPHLAEVQVTAGEHTNF